MTPGDPHAIHLLFAGFALSQTDYAIYALIWLVLMLLSLRMCWVLRGN